MMLSEQGSVPISALPIREFRDHLRLGTGFADDALQDTVLESYLRAALAAIEGRTGKALLARDFLWTETHWRDPGEQALPLAPVRAVRSVAVLDAAGERTVIDPERYWLLADIHRPRVVAKSGSLPGITVGGSAEIAFAAGFGPSWSDVPADLAQAVLLLAALYYEQRSGLGLGTEMPFGVMTLIERWRVMRVLGGGAS